MRHLSVKDFSCIKTAELEFSKFTVIIGPQASGKSVLCKLNYFFLDVVLEQSRSIARQASWDDYLRSIETQFKEWFPVAAWGTRRFSISFRVGRTELTIQRMSSRKPSSNVKVTFCDETKVFYGASLKKVLDSAAKTKKKSVGLGIEYDWSLHANLRAAVLKSMGSDQVTHQLFVPAGRAFFTSIGKAVMAFEQSGMLDPLTIRFGRMVTMFRERNLYYSPDADAHGKEALEADFANLLGGRYRNVDDRESFLTTDGREIPLGTLSSGQQELLPLALLMGSFMFNENPALVYIEELEAHLFPAAQSQVLRSFIAALTRPKNRVEMILTTHSPYVLATLNTLIKAAQLSQTLPPPKRENLESIVPQEHWLPPGSVRAYCIEAGVVSSVIDADGLVDSSYLDEISNEINDTFGELLELEYGE